MKVGILKCSTQVTPAGGSSNRTEELIGNRINPRLVLPKEKQVLVLALLGALLGIRDLPTSPSFQPIPARSLCLGRGDCIPSLLT